jgi:O-antigen ligase
VKTSVLLLAAVVVAIPCIWGFARWERKGHALRAVVLLLVLEIAEACLYENQDLVPRGLFHPGSGSSQFRLPEIVITLALLGRLVAKKLPKRIGYPALLWTAFGVWLAIEAVEGYMRGNVHSQIPYEAKAIIYVGGGYALAAGVPARRYVEAEVFERLARWFGPLALLLDVMTAGHKAYSLHLPLLPLTSFGIMGTDAATMLAAVGVVALMLEMGKPRRNVWTIVCTVPMLISVVLASQRAALVGLGASLGLVLIITLGPTIRHRLTVHSAEAGLALLAVCAIFLAVVLAPAVLHDRPPKIPFTSTVSSTLNGEGKAESAQDRLNELNAAEHMIPQHWILGSGLGIEYSYWAPGPNVDFVSALTEDIYLDLWLRTGLIGLGLFVLAVLVTFGEGFRTWRRDPDRMIAIFAIALVAVVLGFLVKGGFESIFEKYRLATMLGVLLGMLRSTATSGESTFPLIPVLDEAGRKTDERV